MTKKRNFWRIKGMNPKQISPGEASGIIRTGKPNGLFYFRERGLFVGIDNSRSELFEEEFDTLQDCLVWLAGEREMG